MSKELPTTPTAAIEKSNTTSGGSRIIEAGMEKGGMATPRGPHRHFPAIKAAILAAAGLAGATGLIEERSKADIVLTTNPECPPGFKKTGKIECTNDTPVPAAATAASKTPASTGTPSSKPAPVKPKAKPAAVSGSVDKPVKKSFEERLTDVEETLPIIADEARSAKQDASKGYYKASKAEDKANAAQTTATEAKEESVVVHDALDTGVAGTLAAQSQRIDEQDRRLAELRSKANVEVAAMPGFSVHKGKVSPAFGIDVQYVPHGWTGPGFIAGLGARYAKENKNVPQYSDGDRLTESIQSDTFSVDGNVGFRAPVISKYFVLEATLGPAVVLSHRPGAVVAKGNDGGTYGFRESNAVRIAASGNASALARFTKTLHTGVNVSGRLYIDEKTPVWVVSIPIGGSF